MSGDKNIKIIDWDDPTSFQVVIYDKGELLAEVKAKYEQ